jgi:putative autoinducer-2 (AI-2) aldolase
MNWGMKNRLSQIMGQDDSRCVMLAVDHGYFLGPTEGLEAPRVVIGPLLPFADSIMLTRGILRTCVRPESCVPVVLRVSGGSSIVGEDLSKEAIIASIEDAIRLNASCLAVSVFIGSKYEHQTLMNLARLVDEGEKYGIPILAVTAVGREMSRDSRYLGLACRIAAEFGAHIVKTYYCDDFDTVVRSCPVPLVIAGGRKLDEKDALKLAHDAISSGASGVDMGRNIWQSKSPVSMIRAVRAIVHEGLDVAESYTTFVHERSGSNMTSKLQK